MTPNQQRAVDSDRSKIVLLAGAGSGKTHTLTHRIARLLEDGVPACDMLAVTFTRKATAEMLARLRAMLPTATLPAVRTLHAWGIEVLRHHAEAFQRTPDFQLYHERDGELILRWAHEDAGDDKAHGRKRKTLLKPGPGRSLYLDRLRAADALTFDEVESTLLQLLQENPAVRERWVGRYKHIFVDEFQDTNLAQVLILNQVAPDHLFVVGDPRQAIYGFRGAEPATLVSYARNDADFEVIDLPHNFRSAAAIVEVANKAVDGGWTPMVSGRPDLSGSVRAWSVDHQPSWAAQIVRDVLTRHRPEDVLVLARTWNVLDEIAPRLQDLGIPIDFRVSDDNPWTTAAGDWIRRMIRLSANPADDNLAQLLAEPDVKARRFGGDTGLPSTGELRARAGNERKRLLDVLAEVDPTEFWVDVRGALSPVWGPERWAEDVRREIQFVLARYRACGLSDDAWYAEAQACLDDIDREGVRRRDDFEVYVSAPRDRPSITPASGVRVMTVHGSKGLEADAVVLLDCVESVFPGTGDADEQAESLRIYYVAETRARRELVHVVPRGTRHPFTKRLQPSAPTPYLAMASLQPEPWPLQPWGRP